MTLFGLIGYPLGHSHSPAYFAQKFKAEKIIDHEYRLFPLRGIEELPALLSAHPDLRGFNVTIPYKKTILPFLDWLTPEARSIGAVNTVAVVRNGEKIQLLGHNTDATAFAVTLKRLLGENRPHALVLGTGGAAHAVIFALRQLNLEFMVVSRVKKDSQTLTYDELTPDILSNHFLIIQCTPLGMSPLEDACPALPYEAITPNHILYDLIYNPEETLFLKKGKKKKATLVNGLEMLHLQAEMSWEFWRNPSFRLP
ncbi:MAG: shikimate dehydrogenase family protein [Bacteroidales bacterium]